MEELTKEEIDELKKRHTLYEQMRELYSNDRDYRTYVDKCARSNHISPEVCLLHKTVQEVGLYYIERKKGREPIRPYFTEKIFDDDKAC